MEKFSKISTFVFDVDGVLTDGQLLITENGDLLRSMNVKDGQAIKAALDQAYRVVAITKGSSQGVKKRLHLLGVLDVYDSISEKLSSYQAVLQKYDLEKSEVLYMGDDLPDLQLADEVGLFCCPHDAAKDVLLRADYISYLPGGGGCVREIIERVMRIQDKWNVR